MSRNRVKNSQSLHWMGVVKWVVIAGLLAVLGLSYMINKNQNLHLAQDNYHLDHELKSIEKRNSQLTYELDSMKSPTHLQRKLTQMRSTLVRLSDMGQIMVVRMDQNVRAKLAHIGTMPHGGIDYSAAPVATSSGNTYAAPPDQNSN